MLFEELLAYLDPARAAVSCTACSDFLQTHQLSIYYAAWVAAGTALLFSMLFLSRHSNWAIATPMVSIGQWVQKWPPFTWLAKRKERAMREEDRFNERSEEMIYELVDFIESKRDSTVWSDDECDIEYTRLKPRFPIFKFAVDNPGRVREAIATEIERRRNKRKGVAAPAPISIVMKNRTASARA